MSTLFAQKGEISGKVTDSTNDSPLIGANVVIEGYESRCSHRRGRSLRDQTIRSWEVYDHGILYWI